MLFTTVVGKLSRLHYVTTTYHMTFLSSCCTEKSKLTGPSCFIIFWFVFVWFVFLCCFFLTSVCIYKEEYLSKECTSQTRWKVVNFWVLLKPPSNSSAFPFFSTGGMHFPFFNGLMAFHSLSTDWELLVVAYMQKLY